MNKIIKFLKKVWKWILSLFTRKKRQYNKVTHLSNDTSDKSYHTEVEIPPKLDSQDKSVSKSFKIIREDYSSITTLLKVLSSRKNNGPMNNQDASEKAPAQFTGTMSYSEAEKLILKGYSKILPQISAKCRKNIEILSQSYVKRQNPNINEVYGVIPNVPRSIMCLPKDLITRKVVKRKTKTITIVYNICASCRNSTQNFIDAGITLLSAIKLLELSGIKLRLICCFFASVDSLSNTTECTVANLLLKDYSDRINMLKMCFPLAHPSMLRRFGFKFLETVPNLKSYKFQFGYGSTMSTEDLQDIYDGKDTVILDLPFLSSIDYNVENLIKYIQKNVER